MSNQPSIVKSTQYVIVQNAVLVSKIYITHYPCLQCFKTICSSGIVEIVYLDDYNNDDLVGRIAKDTNIIIRKLGNKHVK